MIFERQQRWPGIFASLGLHGLALCILSFSLSVSTPIAQDIGKMDFVWVSLAKHHTTVALPVEKNRTPKKFQTASSAPVPSENAPVFHSPAKLQPVSKDQQKVSIDALPALPPSAPVSSAAREQVSHASRSSQNLETSEATPSLTKAYPLYRDNPPPQYPESARRRGFEGIVLVHAEVLADGSVGKTLIRKSSGYAILDQTALNAVRNWKFEPAKKSGIPYKTWAELPIKFMISDHPS